MPVPTHVWPILQSCTQLRLRALRNRWLAHPDLHSLLERTLTRKPPSNDDLKALLPVAWWPGCPASSGFPSSSTSSTAASAGSGVGSAGASPAGPAGSGSEAAGSSAPGVVASAAPGAAGSGSTTSDAAEGAEGSGGDALPSPQQRMQQQTEALAGALALIEARQAQVGVCARHQCVLGASF